MLSHAWVLVLVVSILSMTGNSQQLYEIINGRHCDPGRGITNKETCNTALLSLGRTCATSNNPTGRPCGSDGNWFNDGEGVGDWSHVPPGCVTAARADQTYFNANLNSASTGGDQVCKKIVDCAYTNGTAYNTENCQCGTSLCTTTTGLYCTQSSNTCENNLRGIVTTLETTVAAEQTKVTTLETTVAAEQTKVTTLETTVAAEQTKVTALETSLAAEQIKVTALQTALGTINTTESTGADAAKGRCFMYFLNCSKISNISKKKKTDLILFHFHSH